MSSGRNWRGGRDYGAHFPNAPPLISFQATPDFPWWLFEERVVARPFGSTRPLTIESPPRLFIGERTTQAPTQEQESRLTQEEQKNALKKLKIETYNASPKMISKRLNSFYRDYATISYNDKGNLNDEDGKRCAICLEDFEPNEEVMVTPCNHMFHRDCIVPWVKSHGQCPVCRFVLYERRRESTWPVNNSTTANMSTNDLIIAGLWQL
ncbi:hypothetical protein L1049_024747 [Liquidambar formosana]|uniref:RING-type domain-containing protein n=1 Tax=Liquidambar formosana TaxID=63359 RepID=A0AAP0RVN6_LIQFO